MTGPYDDIIDLPHHESQTHPRMSISNRAAQFAPFAALTGYDAAVKETARYTNERPMLDENALAILDRKLQLLAGMIDQQPEISVCYFLEDEKKDGGSYAFHSGALSKIDDYERQLIFSDDEKVLIADIIEIECDEFGALL